MIIVDLKGGLGNQMFRAATGLALSKKHNKKLIIDTSFLIDHQMDDGDYVARNFELKIFQKLEAKIIDGKNRNYGKFKRVFLRKSEEIR